MIRGKGHWVAGGNLAFPLLLAILLWWSSLFKRK
nr:MAG TPA: YvrJ protein family protein [Caudoviricetes sp.]